MAVLETNGSISVIPKSGGAARAPGPPTARIRSARLTVSRSGRPWRRRDRPAGPPSARPARPCAGRRPNTASERTVRSRPDSSSWIAAALVPGRRGDHVAQHGRVVAGLLREAGAALERLDHEVVGDVAREAEVDGGVDQRLHDEEHVGRAGAGDRGRHRDPLLVLDLQLRAERAQQGAGLVALVGGRGGRRVPDGHAVADPGRRVGHRPHDLVVAEGRDEGVGRRARRAPTGPAGPARSCGPISRPTLREHLRLDGEDDDVRAGDGLGVGRDGAGSRGPPPARRGARRAGGSRRPATASTRLPRSRPAIIASAMTPEPTVAIVRFARGDIAPEDSTGFGAVSGGAGQPASAASEREEPAGRRAARCPGSPPGASAASTTPGSCHVHGDARRAGRRPGPGAARSTPGGRRAGAGSRSEAAATSRPAPRTRPSRNAATTASAPGSPAPGRPPTGRRRGGGPAGRWATSRSRARSSAAPSGSEACSSPLSASSGEKKPTPAAGSSIRPAERQARRASG